MREICYRGRCTGEDDVYGWVDGFYVRLRDPFKKRESHRIYTGFAECDCGDFYGDWYEVDPKTVGQFTGLFDGNNKRIFENDIVRTTAVYNSRIGKVVFINGSFSIFVKDFGMLPITTCVTVIGNIYDNPKLME